MKIVLIGAGNVGYHLGRKLHGVGKDVVQVFSRRRNKAILLAELINANAVSSFNKIDLSADLIILAIHDDGIKDVGNKLAQIGCENKLVVHTSGATPLTIFANTGLKRYGIFYPLQTFSISKEPKFETIPFCVDANSRKDLDKLKNLALKISPNVNYINDEQRAIIHVAAVFVNNFTNHLFHIAQDILTEKNISLELLKPLINETIEKIETNDPIKMQTGPAIRRDEETIKRHLKLLNKNSDYRKIYQILTKSIQNVNN